MYKIKTVWVNLPYTDNERKTTILRDEDQVLLAKEIVSPNTRVLIYMYHGLCNIFS